MAREAGLDGVELNAAHASNRRSEDWDELLRFLRAALSSDGILGLRLYVQMPNTDLLHIYDGRVTLRGTLGGEEQKLHVDAVVASVPLEPNAARVSPLVRAGTAVQVVGDAFAPRTALQAFREDDAAGRAV